MKSKSNRALLEMYGLPVLESLEDISLAMRLSKGLLYRMSSHSSLYYRIYQIPKKTGGQRDISQPNRVMKAAQAWILRHILDFLKVASSSKGFQRNQSILDNAIPHIRANAILKIDFEDFFPNITQARIFNVFRTIGYNEESAGILTALTSLENGLPQGAPTSPKLANLACIRLDRRLEGFTGRQGIVYTRYADDLTFSALQVAHLYKSSNFIKKIIRSEGFNINEKKTAIKGPGSQRKVTGLIINESTAGIGREKYRELRAKIFGLTQVDKANADFGAIRKLKGYLAFVKGVDKKRCKMLESYLGNLKSRFPDTAVSLIL